MTRYSRRRLLRLASAVGAGVGTGLVIGTGTAAYLLKVLQAALQPQITVLPPMIVSRAVWGARRPDHKASNEFGFDKSALGDGWYVYPDDLADVYNMVVVHHSAQPLATNQTMRDIQNLHMNANHWADIGYHYGIDKNGVIYEGRRLQVRGASVAGHNTGVIGVVVMGNFEVESPMKAQLRALQTLVNWLAVTYTLTHLAGHREFNPQSVCPGKRLGRHLDHLANGASLERGTAGYIAPAE